MINTKTGRGNNFLAGENISSRSQGGVMTGENIAVDVNCEKYNITGSENVFVANGCVNINVTNSSSIIIGIECEDINLVNCSSVNISDGVTDFQGFGLSGVTITTADSGTNKFADLKAEIITVSESQNANFNISKGMTYLDLSGGNINATFPDPTLHTGKEFTLYVQTAGVGTSCTLVAFGAETINGAYTLATANDSVCFTSNGTNWYKKY